jgi:hypothetical protein
MKLSVLLLSAGIVLFILPGCSSTTMISSKPEGAKLYMDEQYKGTTPYSYSDTKIVGSSTPLRLELEGYAPFRTTLVRSERADVGAIIGGIFVLVPFLWTMQYNPDHTYELRPAGSVSDDPVVKTSLTKDKAEALRETRKLYDEGTLTKDEYEREKQKILDGK